MDRNKPEWERVDVGASKAAKVLLGGIDRRLVKPAAFLVRISGWILVVITVYLTLFENFNQRELKNIDTWIYIYVAYMLMLEIARKRSSEIYEKPLFRGVRIIFNLVMISVLVSIAPMQRHLLIFAFTVPLFATIVYSGENHWLKLGVFALSLFGIYCGAILFPAADLRPGHFIIYTIVLACLTIGFEVFRRRIKNLPSHLTELAKGLHKTLDLQQLMSEILMNAMDVTLAQMGLIIVINPRTKRYVGHILINLKLKPEQSIENLALKCFVLTHARAFASPDIVTEFNDKSIYHEFFETQPRSVLAEPLHNRAGQVMGVINVGHNDSNGFDKISRSQLKEFAFLVGNAIENCFEHREVKLREAKSKEAGEKFVSANNEDEAIHILIEELRQQVPHAEKLTVHQYIPNKGDLLPIHSFSLDATPNLYLWTSIKSKKLKPDLRLGYGIAGHALEIKDTILVPDTDHHPWYVKLDQTDEIASLLVAPLYNPKNDELYGTVSLESKKRYAFNLEDESTLTYLSTQASRAFAKVKEFQAWREQGGTLRKILDEIRIYDLSSTEDEILQQLTDFATRLLGFKFARIRILNEAGQLVTKAVSGVPERTRKKLLGTELPYSQLEPFLIEKHKAESSYLIKHGDTTWKKFVDRYFHVPKKKTLLQQDWHPYDALITPLFDSSGKILGLLALDMPVSGSVPNQQILESVGVFASSASWMIELSRFQRRLTDQQYRAQSFIDTISQELAKGRDLATICEVVVQVGAKLLSADGCSLHLVRGNYIQLTHSNFLAHTDHISRSKPISTNPKSGLTSWVAATGEVLCFNNGKFQEHPAWASDNEHLQYLPGKTCRSVLLAPIKHNNGKVIGVITLENKRILTGPKDFDDSDKARLVSLANEFAKALEVIGLYEDIKEWERIELADDLHDLINWYHSGVVLWIEALEEWLKRGEEEKIKELMPQLHAHAYTTVFELKALHTNMLNKSLEAESLKQALDGTMSAWRKRITPKYKEQMRVNLDCPERIEIPVGVRNTLVRIASLAFSNALLHSGIIEDPDVEVQVCVEQESGSITLAVVDNGRGIDFNETPEGYGFDRMRQLSKKINTWDGVESDLEIDTAMNMGTRIFLRLQFDGKTPPIRRGDDHEQKN